ncbi:RNA 3'-terminal phosphate cyclase [Tahibacter caeni]|uniref:RNA 3'-terminal phosphate cyclase n=1 Tax=Tahibacter caeni TaxID=1453545 RepID=UPI0021492C6A|nr:RNA 3'-terminal phosphate cyclase [Tahibacter caeni]
MKARTESLIELDGAQGEGGGQILRTALSLAMLQRRPLRLRNIRARRSKPGLMRQHLVCVQAAAAVSGADVSGAEIGSTALEFRPGAIRAGEYAFRIGSAGSTLLVLQTVLPALLRAGGRSQLVLEGGTHNRMAPSADFVATAFLPQLARMGADVGMSIERHGFYPAGGGRIHVDIAPTALSPLALHERGAARGIEATALLRNLPRHIAERELDTAAERFALTRREVRDLPAGPGPANALVLTAQFDHVSEVVVGLGEQGVAAENVARGACDELRAYLAHGAPVGEHLADQLLLPLVLAGGSFVTGRPSTHLETNAAVIRAFDAAAVDISPDDGDPQRRYRVSVQR